MHLQKIKLGNRIDTELLSKMSVGFSGADIANLCNEAAIFAVRRESKVVEMHDFESAVERVLGGVKEKRFLSDSERERLCLYQAGKSTVSWLLGIDVMKVSIVGKQRKVMVSEKLKRRSDLMKEVCVLLGGRVSEELFMDGLSTTGSQDLASAYKLCRKVVLQYGMGTKLRYYEDGLYTKPFSDRTNKDVDDEIKRMIDQCSQECRQLLLKNKDRLMVLKDKLLEKESISRLELKELLG